MTDKKQYTAIKVRRDAIEEYLKTPGIRMIPALFCYVFLALKRPRLFDRSNQQLFKWRGFRGTSITAKEVRSVEAFLDLFEGNCPNPVTVRANLKNPEYMKRAASRIEREIILQELRHHSVDRAIVAEMRQGFERLESFRRLLKRAPILRPRDVSRRLHVPAAVVQWLIKHEQKVGRIRVLRYSSGPRWIVRSKPPIFYQGIKLKP
jgi:hypothetical protein